MSIASAMTELLALTKSAGVPGSVDPSEVNTPGAWLALDGLGRKTVRGTLELRCSLYLIAPDTDTLRALEALEDLLTATLTVLAPDGPITTQGVVLPGDSTPLPAFRVPVNLYTESE